MGLIGVPRNSWSILFVRAGRLSTLAYSPSRCGASRPTQDRGATARCDVAVNFYGRAAEAEALCRELRALGRRLRYLRLSTRMQVTSGIKGQTAIV
ncbi:MAG TPA: hypothetical protein VLH36_10175 [Steroidobacteraceae bacterium]|nr:hypothetical protein [Steroidobacteraceae bacterium]